MTRATQLVTEGIQPSADADANTLADDAVLDQIREAHDASMPKATKAAYATPMREFREWALKQAVDAEGKRPLEELDDLERGLEEFKRYSSIVHVHLQSNALTRGIANFPNVLYRRFPQNCGNGTKGGGVPADVRGWTGTQAKGEGSG